MSTRTEPSPLSPLATQIKALAFDVFGTCVDWRHSVTTALTSTATAKIASPAFASLPPATQHRVRALSADDWAAFAQLWRTSYHGFTRGFVPGVTPWKDIDAHHLDSLVELLRAYELDGLHTPAEAEALSRIWHALRPWPDSAEGLQRLGARFVTTTLSNGNRSLLADLDDFGSLGFERLLSAEDFKAYKPSPEVYLGACELLGLEPAQVAMVAAHLGDLDAARKLGLRTVYVERRGEEEWRVGEDRYQEARGWVDIWVSEDEAGFVAVAKRLGV